MGGRVDISSISFTIYVALIPSILICLFIYHTDVDEKEPIKMLLSLFFIGALITIPAVFFEQVIISSTKLDYKNVKDCFFLAFLVIGLVEEGYKFLVLLISSWKSKEFNYKYDAIVYGVFISLGFAALENIVYVYKSDLIIALYRGLISVPAHAFYAVASGFFIGMAKEKSIKYENGKAIYYLLLAFIIPVLLHGTFDFILLMGNSIMYGIFFVFIACLYLVSFYIIKKTNKGNKLK